MGTGTENLTIGFFLFGDVYKEHWKLQVGTIVGLLNPSIMKQEKVRLIFNSGFRKLFCKITKIIWFDVRFTAQKMKFSIKDFFSKCDQIRSFGSGLFCGK